MTTDITELALKPTRYGTNSQGVFTNQTDGAYVSYLDFVALVEELEKAQQRIDELDSRTVKLPKLKMLEDYLAEVAIEERKQILVGVKLEFHRALAAAGIKMEAE
ncbi:hypothetical protein MXM21_06860 [Klebsiella variicola]|uniref:hypothetical protein n=1 Tax=Klebsiella variicola TaxID=244366 RepID=UPI002DBCCC84|nr:hypothetical protein [Klebsiella variicola]MEB6441321.1 hypothetical protein [Klebsiella variicola]